MRNLKVLPVVAAAVLTAGALSACGGSDDEEEPTVTPEQWSQVDLGQSKDEVEETLGAQGRSGSHEAQTGGQTVEFNDCWFYDPGDAVVCFEIETVSHISTPSELFESGSGATAAPAP